MTSEGLIVSVTGANGYPIVDLFDDLDLQEGLLRGINSYGFEKPSAVQQRGIRPVLDGPCAHLMFGTQYACLYDQEETHYCISSKPDYGCCLKLPETFSIDSLNDYVSVFMTTDTPDSNVQRECLHRDAVWRWKFHS